MKKLKNIHKTFLEFSLFSEIKGVLKNNIIINHNYNNIVVFKLLLLTKNVIKMRVALNNNSCIISILI